MNRQGGLQAVLDRFFARVAVASARRPMLVIVLALVALGVGLYGATLARQDNSLDAYFHESDPSFSAYKQYIEEFSSDEVIYLLYDAPGKEYGPFDLEVMRKVGQLTDALEREVPFTRKVTSLANAEFIESQGDEVQIHALLSDFPKTQGELLRVRDVALSKPLFVNAIVSPDARYGGIVVEMTRTSTDHIDKLRHDPKGGDGLPNLYPQVPDKKLREILARPEYQGLRFWISGDVPMNSAYNELIGADIGTTTLLTFALVAVMSIVFLGIRPMGILAPLLVVMLSLVLTLGLMGFVGWKINLFFVMIPTLLCAMGVAQAVHVLLAWQRERAHTPDPVEAVRRTVVIIGVPCMMVVVTDAIGFLGTGISELRALGEMAWYAAFGVLMTFVLSMTLLIAISARSKKPVGIARPTAAVRWLQGRMDGVVEFNLRHGTKLLVVFALVTVGALVGVTKLRVDFNFLKEFRPEIEWRQHTEKLNEVMGGLLSVVYVFDTGQSDGIKTLEVLKQVEGLQEVAKTLPVAQYTMSIVDIVKDLNMAFHGGDKAYYVLPEDRDTLAQLLLVYELSGGKEMSDVLNVDRSKTALQVRLKMVAASEVRQFTEAMDRYLAAHPQTGVRVETSGIGLLWVVMAEYISDTQIQGYAITFGVIALFMMLTFGSVRLGALAMIPNVFPIVLTLGLMGWLDWHLDYFRLLLATIAIGIAVDDTIHFVSSYKRCFTECGNYEESLRKTMPEIGPSMIVMTVILVVACSSYHISNLAIIASFGTLLTFTIGMAVLSDLFLMPTLLLRLKPLGPEHAPLAAQGELLIDAGSPDIKPEAV